MFRYAIGVVLMSLLLTLNIWRRSDVFIINFEHISHLFLVSLLLTLSRQMPAGIIYPRKYL